MIQIAAAPNKTPEPTPGSVTPRATERLSKSNDRKQIVCCTRRASSRRGSSLTLGKSFGSDACDNTLRQRESVRGEPGRSTPAVVLAFRKFNRRSSSWDCSQSLGRIAGSVRVRDRMAAASSWIYPCRCSPTPDRDENSPRYRCSC